MQSLGPMKKIIIYFFALLCFPQVLLAQNDAHASPTAPDSAWYETVVQNRRELLDLFYTRNLDSVRLALTEFDRRPEISVLWPAERLLLYYWIENYAGIDSLIRSFDKIAATSELHHPPDQIVWNVLSYQATQDIDELVSWIDQSGCSDAKFDFLVRLLETVTHDDRNDQKAVNNAITQFIKANPLPKDEPGASNIMTVEPEYAEAPRPDAEPWKFGVGIGAGRAFSSGHLADYLSPRACIYFNFDLYYQRWRFSLFMQAASGKLKKDIWFNYGSDVWAAGQSANLGNVGLTVGYAIADEKLFRITPFVGFSVNGCTPSEQAVAENEVLQDAGIRRGFSSAWGLDTELKLHGLFSSLKHKDMFACVDLKLMYAPAAFNNVSSRYSGNMFYLIFGINFDISY